MKGQRENSKILGGNGPRTHEGQKQVSATVFAVKQAGMRTRKPTQLFALVQNGDVTTHAVPRFLKTSATSACHVRTMARHSMNEYHFKIQTTIAQGFRLIGSCNSGIIKKGEPLFRKTPPSLLTTDHSPLTANSRQGCPGTAPDHQHLRLPDPRSHHGCLP